MKLRRRFTGIEINEEYAALARERLGWEDTNGRAEAS